MATCDNAELRSQMQSTPHHKFHLILNTTKQIALQIYKYILQHFKEYEKCQKLRFIPYIGGTG